MAAYGSVGVETAIKMLQSETARTMGNCCKVNLASLDRTLVAGRETLAPNHFEHQITFSTGGLMEFSKFEKEISKCVCFARAKLERHRSGRLVPAREVAYFLSVAPAGPKGLRPARIAFASLPY
jgi:hypothetical protein